MENKEIEINFGRIVKVMIRKVWLIVLVAAAVFAGSMFLLGQSDHSKLYSANATVYSVANGSYRQALEGTYAMKDYAEIIRTQKICERAALLLGDESIDSNQIMNSIGPDFSEDSAILTIYAYDEEPKKAMEIANAVANAFVIEMRTITGSDDIQLLDEAYTYKLYSDRADSIKAKRMILVVVAVFLVCAYIALNEIFTSRLKTVCECTMNGELELLGVIPVYKTNGRGEVNS